MCYYSCKKQPQISWLKITEVCSLIVLEVRSLTRVSLGKHQGDGRAVFLSGHSRGETIYLPFPASGAHLQFWIVGASLPIIGKCLPSYVVISLLF